MNVVPTDLYNITGPLGLIANDLRQVTWKMMASTEVIFLIVATADQDCCHRFCSNISYKSYNQPSSFVQRLQTLQFLGQSVRNYMPIFHSTNY